MAANRTRKKTLAAQADKYALYLKSVQEPSVEVAFFDRTFRRLFRRAPVTLREDFCGAAAICYEWARYSKKHRAVGIDLDAEPLAWGQEHLTEKIDAATLSRVTLLQQDVRDVSGPKGDIVAAQNFSFWVFKTRPEVVEYFRAALKNLGRQGMLILDMMGGYDLLKQDQEDVKSYRGFKYIWEQERFDPLTHDALFHIHFRFPDGSEIKRAFTYDWRLWTIPEVREMLLEAGFDGVDVYWEDCDKKTGNGNGVFRRRERGTNDPSWVTYVMGIKS
jgi:hypothetical protein